MLRMDKAFVVPFFRIAVSPLVCTPICFISTTKSKDDVMLFSIFPLQAVGRYNVHRFFQYEVSSTGKGRVFKQKIAVRTREVDRIDRKVC
jgi:hypothetical protein